MEGEAGMAPEPLDALLGELGSRAASADHFEFYWFPHTDVALTKTNTRLPESTVRRPLPKVGRWIDETVLANGLYRGVCAVGTMVPGMPSFE